jgi:O-antigen ligase
MGGKAERYFVPATIGFAPFVLMLLTWAPGGRSPAQALVQAFYLPIVGVELFVVAVALREGLIGAMRRWSWPRLATAALLLLVTVAIVTAIVAPNPLAARIWTGYWLVHLLFGFSVAHLCTRSLGRLDLVLAYLLGFAVFVAGALLFATRVTDPGFDWVHAWPAVTHIRHFGYYATAMIALCIGLAATERRRRVLAWLLVFSTGGFAFALWTGSRGTIVGVAGALLAGLIFIPAVRRIVVWAGTALSLALGALIASLLPAHGPLMGFGRTIAQTVDSGDVSTGRTQIWLNALGAIEKRPVFGYGEAQMATVAPFGTLGQTHDVILQILLAWGVVGLACVAVLGVWYLARSLPVVRGGGPDTIAPLMAMLALASLSVIDGSLYHVLPVSIFAACAGMVASRWLPRPDAVRRGEPRQTTRS